MRCQVTRGRLLAALKSVLPCTSGDITREHLQCVAVVAERVGDIPTLAFVSTDGHAMTIARVQVTEARFSPQSQQILLRQADAKALVKILAHKKSESHLPVEVSISGNPQAIQFQVHGGTVARYVEPDCQYVPWRQVIPPAREKGEAQCATLVGINPAYLGRASEAAITFTQEFRRRNGRMYGFEWSVPPTALDPLRLDLQHPEAGDLTCIIMPMVNHR